MSKDDNNWPKKIMTAVDTDDEYNVMDSEDGENDEMEEEQEDNDDS